MTDIQPFFSEEMQLVGWRDSHTQGPTVTFRLKASEDLEAFRALTLAKDGKSGQRIAAVMVLIGDDEQPEPVQAAHRKLGPLATLAMQWCRDPVFRKWLLEQDESFEGEASARLKSVCGVGSRREIDILPTAAIKFHKMIREPYMKFLEAKK